MLAVRRGAAISCSAKLQYRLVDWAKMKRCIQRRSYVLADPLKRSDIVSMGHRHRSFTMARCDFDYKLDGLCIPNPNRHANGSALAIALVGLLTTTTSIRQRDGLEQGAQPRSFIDRPARDH